MKRYILAGLAAAAAIGAAPALMAQVAEHGGGPDPSSQPPSPPAAAPAPPQGGGRGNLGPRVGQAVPSGYAAFPVDPAMVARGKTLFAAQCASCHAMDIRGTDKGPNLRRSTYMLNDIGNGKMVGVETRENAGHGDAFLNLSDADAADITHYLKSFPPRGQGSAEIGIPAVFTVGNATAGKAYFDAHCASCHAVTPGGASSAANLAGIGARITDPKTLQQAWLSPTSKQPTMAVVTMKDGSTVQGPATAAGEFTVTLTVNGQSRVIERKDAAKIDMTYPLIGHARLLRTISDTNIHDVTGYLVTLK